MKTYFATVDGATQLDLNGAPMMFDSPADAAHILGDYFDLHMIKPLDRHNFGARFVFTVYDHNGDFMQSFECHLDHDDGGFTCTDSEFSDDSMIYAEIAEQAQCDFVEIGAQSGAYENPNFECDCDAIGSAYAWIISAI